MSKELQDLHPLVHAHILTKLFKLYPNLYTDISWDVLPKTIYLNYNSAIKPGYYSHENHGDLDVAAARLFNKTAIVDLRNEARTKMPLTPLITSKKKDKI